MKAFLIFTISLTLSFATKMPTWKELDSRNIDQDPTIQKLLNFGLNSFLPLAIEKKAVSDSDWVIDQVHSVRTQVVSGMNYKIQLSLKDSKKSVIDVDWLINYQTWKDEATLSSWDVSTPEIKVSPRQQPSMDLDSMNLELKKATDKLQENSSDDGMVLLAISLSALGKKMMVAQNKQKSISSSEMIEFAMKNSDRPIGAWKLENNQMDAEVIKGMRYCLNKIETSQGDMSFNEWEITDLYLHMSQVATGMIHKVTFRIQNGDNVKTMQVTYVEKPWASEDDRFSLDSYLMFDNNIRFVEITEMNVVEMIDKAAELSMRLIKPEKILNAAPKILRVNSAELSEKKLFYTDVIIEGENNFVSGYYEMWFSSPKEITSDKDLSLLFYVKLDINKGSVESERDLTKLSLKNEEADCSDIPSFLICSLHSKCTNQDFVAQSLCKSR